MGLADTLCFKCQGVGTVNGEKCDVCLGRGFYDSAEYENRLKEKKGKEEENIKNRMR